MIEIFGHPSKGLCYPFDHNGNQINAEAAIRRRRETAGRRKDAAGWRSAVHPRDAWATLFARTARERMRIDGGGYPRDHLRALAQRVAVADRKVRIIGSKTNLLQTLTATAGVKPATPGVRSSVLKWRMGCPFSTFDRGS